MPYHFNKESVGEMSENLLKESEDTGEDKVIFLNVKIILLFIVGIAGLSILIVFLYSMAHNYHFSGKPSRRRRRRSYSSRRRSKNRRRDLHF